ncbi:MAG: hypothetical protein J5I93_27770 [Pirellulaceae bacterium]|nr:hypothetical protein [Pirellulaceae bacterium]
MSHASEQSSPAFVDRRTSFDGHPPAEGERRQFANSHGHLSPAARELAEAIDRYKLWHRRRFIDCEEMLGIILQLGYRQTLADAPLQRTSPASTANLLAVDSGVPTVGIQVPSLGVPQP